MGIEVLDVESFDSFVKEGKTVVDFYADWCGPCKIMAPHFEKVADEEEEVRFAKVDVDDNQELAERFGILSIPTTIFFKDGEVVDRKSGALMENEIKDTIKESMN